MEIEGKIEKSACVKKQAVDEGELALINEQSLRTLTADEVFTFKIAACDNQVDRDFERFTEKTLDELAQLYVGRTVIMDHTWSAANQTARIYAAGTETEGDVKRLVLRAYMLRGDTNQPAIDAIEGGILREVSVGCAVKKRVCSICGKDAMSESCPHYPGREYSGKTCHYELEGATDAYEVSFVAVPAQPGAGIIKRYGNAPEEEPEELAPDQVTKLAQARLEIEKLRFGGNEHE